MASFGSFETERELYSDHSYTVYSAKRTGDPKTEYAVKVFALQRSGFDTETVSELEPLMGDIERSYVERIAVQQKAAAASQCIAAIFESGHDERGVWYVTRFYARSVNRIISGRVALNLDALQRIVHSVAQGALDMKRACGRSHGDIRPTNIQISRSEKLSDAEVVLSDPLPGAEDDAERYELADLRAVGRTILQLVRQREISSEEDFLILPILSGPEWTRLFGKDTERWLALCNRLLDPNLSLDQLTLEQLVATLDSFKPKSGVSPKLLVTVGAAIVVIGVGVFLAMRPKVRMIEVTSDPPGATILVNKAPQGKAPVKLKLPKGSYTVEARHDELRLLERTANLVVDANSPASTNFQFAYGTISLVGKPAGATIERDGIAIGQTGADGQPVLLTNATGVEVKLKFSKSQFLSREFPVTLTNGERRKLEVILAPDDAVGRVEADSSPRGAVVYNGDERLVVTPDFIRLPEGSYTLTARYSNWPAQVISNVVFKRKQDGNIVFRFPSTRVTIDSQPQNATVFLGTNANSLGQTPLPAPLLLPAGSAAFRFELPGFESTNIVTNLTDGKMASIKATLVSTNGTFDLTSDPPGAQILAAPGELSRTSASGHIFVTVRPGSYQFTARFGGLDDRTETLTVGKSAVSPHTFRFDYGQVRLESVPPGAEVSIEGKPLGATPASFIQKPGLKFTYRLAAKDYLPTNAEVVLASRETRPFSVKLLPEQVAVSLKSDPDGAQFFSTDGALSPNRTITALPWGTNVVVARHPLYASLAPVTNELVIRKGAANEHTFKFKYGTVVLETEPSDATADVFAGTVAIARTPARLFVPPGRVDYAVAYENQRTNFGASVVEGREYAFKATFEVKRDYTNSIEMVLVRAKDVYVGRFEVSHHEYLALMPKGDGMDGRPNEPITNVKWADALEFCRRLSAKDATSLSAKRLAGWTYSLPTETEWMRIAGTDTNQLAEAVFSYTGNTKPLEINPARRSFNEQRIYDLFGNVSEWCLGSNNEPVAIGGNFLSLFSRRNEANWLAMVKNAPRMSGGSMNEAISSGSPAIGFRCVLKAPP